MGCLEQALRELLYLLLKTNRLTSTGCPGYSAIPLAETELCLLPFTAKCFQRLCTLTQSGDTPGQTAWIQHWPFTSIWATMCRLSKYAAKKHSNKWARTKVRKRLRSLGPICRSVDTPVAQGGSAED